MKENRPSENLKTILYDPINTVNKFYQKGEENKKARPNCKPLKTLKNSGKSSLGTDKCDISKKINYQELGEHNSLLDQNVSSLVFNSNRETSEKQIVND